ncbi:MAG: hypothetical protein QOF77_2341 [Solirubrobacteraceae bacterium]|nr:hypothetical protein [Solirubrobacteraceae bacterium]
MSDRPTARPPSAAAAIRASVGRCPPLLAAVIVAGALLVLHLRAGRPSREPPLRGLSAAPPIVIVGSGPPTSASSPPPPQLGPRGASRAFVAAYAAFVYGRLDPTRLPGVTPSVRRQLAAQHPRPPAAVLAVADPRLRSLAVTTSGPDRARAVAVIEDGVAVYQVRLELRRRAVGWTITGLGETS